VKRVDHALERFAEWLALIGGLVVVALMFMVAIDALGRKTFGALPGALEFSEALMVPAVFLPIMFVQLRREHVMVNVATAHLPLRIQAFLDGLMAILGMGIFVLLTWLSMVKALDAFAIREYRVAIIDVPIWPFRWFIPLATALMVLQLFLTALHEFGRAFGKAAPQFEEAPPTH
jgi:TRAP-type C4-dicarboxylate transport system permease small subunit